MKEIHGLPEEDMLPPSPLVILGDVIHEVMKEARADRMQNKQTTTEFMDDLFERKIRLVEERLSKNPRTKRLVPLRRAVGKTEYRNRRALLRSWAKTLCGEYRDGSFGTSPKVSSAHDKPEAKSADTISSRWEPSSQYESPPFGCPDVQTSSS